MTRHESSRRGRHRFPCLAGFTLPELLIVLLVVAALAAVALPAYRESLARGARADVTGELVAAQQWMERFYAENLRYDRTVAGTPVTDPALFPASFSQSPRVGNGQARYAIVLSAPLQPQAYTIVAMRVPGATDDCGDFTVDHTGRRGLQGWSTARFATEAAALQACWRDVQRRG